MIADQTQPWLTQFHEILTKKGGNCSQQARSLHHAPAILLLRRTTRHVREDLVKLCEVRKRPICYHSLRKAHAKQRHAQAVWYDRDMFQTLDFSDDESANKK